MSNDNNDANTTAPSENDADQQYEVGYGKPPKHGQFKPGQSGNPKGKKKKPASVAQQIEYTLSKKVEVVEGGKKRRLTKQQIMFTSIANNAAKGDLKSAEFLLKHKNNVQAETAEFIDQIQMDAEDQAIIDTFVNQIAFGEAVIEKEPSNDNADLSKLEAENCPDSVPVEPEKLPEEIITEVADKIGEKTDVEYQEEDDTPIPPPAPIEPVETHPAITMPDRQNLMAAVAPEPLEPPVIPSVENPVRQLAPSIEPVATNDSNKIIIRSLKIPNLDRAKRIDVTTDIADPELEKK